MFSQNKQFRRPDCSLYDPRSFNMRQYEELYGPSGVPEGWSMGATARHLAAHGTFTAVGEGLDAILTRLAPA